MKRQLQHRISQVYLKEFGYQTKSGQWKISTLEKEKYELMKKINKLLYSQKSIESVTAEYNIFDLSQNQPIKSSVFEDFNGTLETNYPTLINDLYLYSKLSESSEILLIQFISNLLCRVDSFRQLINSHLEFNRTHFLNAMCIFQEDKGKRFMKLLSQYPVENQLNIVCFMVMEHITYKLSHFNFIIINEYENRGWITSDNPVVLNNNIEENSIFSINTEVYFPLSKDFCAYFSHSNANIKENSLRTFKNKSFVSATREIQEMIYEEIRLKSEKFIFFPLEINERTPLYN